MPNHDNSFDLGDPSSPYDDSLANSLQHFDEENGIFGASSQPPPPSQPAGSSLQQREDPSTHTLSFLANVAAERWQNIEQLPRAARTRCVASRRAADPPHSDLIDLS